MSGRGKEAAQALISLANGGDRPDFDAFINVILHEHRTLQQTTGRLIQALIRVTAENPHCDLRNEAWVNFCKRVAPVIEECPLPYI